MKKFAVVGTTIFLSIIIFFAIFKTLLGNKIVAADRGDEFIAREDIQVKYLGFENTDAGTNIIISIKNNSSEIVNFDEVTIDFSKKANSSFDFNNVTIKAVKKDWYDYYNNQINITSGKDYEDKMGIEPNEEIEYLFYIQKGISFDKDIYNLDNMSIFISGNTYKFRLSNNSLLGGFSSFGSSVNIINTGEPIVIE